jgi:hypothetical protein
MARAWRGMAGHGKARPCRAETGACRSDDHRCSPFPDRREDAQAGGSAQRAPERPGAYRVDRGQLGSRGGAQAMLPLAARVARAAPAALGVPTLATVAGLLPRTSSGARMVGSPPATGTAVSRPTSAPRATRSEGVRQGIKAVGVHAEPSSSSHRRCGGGGRLPVSSSPVTGRLGVAERRCDRL